MTSCDNMIGRINFLQSFMAGLTMKEKFVFVVFNWSYFFLSHSKEKKLQKVTVLDRTL